MPLFQNFAHVANATKTVDDFEGTHCRSEGAADVVQDNCNPPTDDITTLRYFKVISRDIDHRRFFKIWANKI